MRKLGPVRGHEVGRLHRAQRDDVFVRAAVAHDADRFHRKEHRESLRGLLVPARRAQFVDEDRIGVAQEIGILAFHFPEDANPEPRAGEGMPEHHVVRQSEREAQLAHFVLEELA
jgi:hypothetical protein